MAKEKRTEEPPVVVPADEPAFLAQYRATYPDSPNFHVTGDNMVFLGHEYDKAVSHQKSCGKGELKTY